MGHLDFWGIVPLALMVGFYGFIFFCDSRQRPLPTLGLPFGALVALV